MAYTPNIFRHEDDGSTTKMTLATKESMRNLGAELTALRRDNAVLKRALLGCVPDNHECPLPHGTYCKHEVDGRCDGECWVDERTTQAAAEMEAKNGQD